jgi:hypothetical protein
MAADPRLVREAVRMTETRLQGMVEPTERLLQTTGHTITNTAETLNAIAASLREKLELTKQALKECEERKGRDKRVNCNRLLQRHQNLERKISQLASLQQEFNRAADRYRIAATGARQAIYEDIPAACHWLRQRETALSKFDNSGGVDLSSNPNTNSRLDKSARLGQAATATRDGTAATTFSKSLSGMGNHGSLYKKAQQQHLRSLLNDPYQPGYVRGWVKQEINRIENRTTAIAEGRRPPGGGTKNTWRRIRAIPGLDTGHRYPGLDLPETFRQEERWMNRRRFIVAKKLGIEDTYR